MRNKQMIVHVKEISSLRIHNPNADNTEMYTLLLPHLVEEFRNSGNNYVAVSCMPPFPFNVDSENKYVEYIEANLKNSDTKIIFDNVYEGHTISCFRGIYRIVEKLKLDPKNCYFISGGMQAHEFHNKYCGIKNIHNKINIIVLNSWERHISLRHHLNESRSFVPAHHITNKEKLFLCFNRIIRPHRVALLGLLYSRNLVDNSYYSFFPSKTYGDPNENPLAELQPWLNSSIYEVVKNHFNMY